MRTRMIRRILLPGTAAVLCALGVTTAPALPTDVATSLPASWAEYSRTLRPELVQAADTTTIYYQPSISEAEVIGRAQGDADKLGVKLIKTLAAGKAMVVAAPESDVATRLEAVEGIPFSRLSASYQIRGDQHPRSIIAFTDRLMIRFAPQATEAQKEAFYTSQHFRRIHEYASGDVLVETGRRPDAAMLEFATALPAREPLVERAFSDFLMTGELTANSDSIILQDKFFDLQWYLYNSNENTNFSLGLPDEDLDVPRAWMINQRNMKFFPGQFANGIFGDSSIVVGIFDTGTDTSHEDLAESIDSRIGFDAVDGGLPTPFNSPLGAHGTAMAGLIAAQANTKGIVGVAPGVKIYTLRIFAGDLSASSTRLSQAITDTIFKNVDVNVHAYALPLSDSDGALTGASEAALRQSFESGRLGIGTVNLAASGNFFAQVEYPAQSSWALSVGGVSSEGTRIRQSNWGGKGIDFAMPSYVIEAGPSFTTGGTGVVTTDLNGNAGVQGNDASEPGNEAGRYGAIGFVSGFGSPDITTSNSFQGTSVATALAGGVVALMLSDERYTALSPAESLGREIRERQDRRDRAPARPNDSNVLSKLRNFADLPGNQLEYIDQYNEFLGFGRPNPARFLAPENIGVPVSPDAFSLGLLAVTPIYTAFFGLSGLAGDNESDLTRPALEQGWGPDAGARLSATIGTTGPPTVISPYLEGLSTLYFENGDIVSSEPTEEGDSTFFYVWTDSLTTSPSGSENLTGNENLVYNPLGTYRRSTRIRLNSPPIPGPAFSLPMVLKISLAHELGVQTAVNGAFSGPAGKTITVGDEVDQLNVILLKPPDEEGAPPEEVVLGQITGDSTGRTKSRLVPATVTEITPDVFRPTWQAGTNFYNPWVADSQMLIREYLFFIPPFAAAADFRLALELNPGASVLPTWRFRPGTGGGPPEAEQVNNVFRDHKGFILFGVQVDAMDPAYKDFLDRTLFEVADGLYPTWSSSKHDIMLTQLAFDSNSSFLVQADPFQLYLTDPNSLTGPSPRPNIRLTETVAGEVITGLKNHPVNEIMAMTTRTTGGAGYVYTITNDGVNQTRIIDPSLTVGARDPSWALNGAQLVYCSNDYIRVASRQTDGSYAVETLLTSSNFFLHDFHSPVFDPLAGVVYFTARRKDPGAPDTSLNLYMSSRTGRLLSFNADYRLPLVAGWEGVDLFDLDLSQSGKRLIFAANASSAPTLIGDTIEEGAQGSSTTRLFTIENLDFISNFNDPAIYRQVVLQSVDEGYPKNAARYPRISPDSQEIVWMAYNFSVNANTSLGNGRIVRQPIGLGAENAAPPVNTNPIETPVFPTPSPTGTPIPSEEGQVVYTGGFNFAVDTQGWEFGSAAPALDAPQFNYENVDPVPSRIANGVVGLLVSSADQVLGNNVSVATLRFTALQSGTVNFSLLNVSPRLTHTYDNLGNNLPTDLQTADVNITKGGSNANIFLTPVSQNVQTGQQFDVALLLDTNGQPVYNLEAYMQFDEQLLRFEFGTINAAEFEGSQALGRITLRSVSNNTFGFANSALSSLQVAPDALYLYRARISATPGTADSQAPTVRLRVNSVNLESAFTTETNSLGDLKLSPNAAGPKNIDLLFKPPSELFTLPISRRRYSYSVDILNFDVNDAPNGGITIHGIDLYRLDDGAAKSVIGTPVVNVFQSEFDSPSARDLWYAGPFLTQFTAPTFGQTTTSLTMQVTNPANTFGFWTADGDSIPAGDTSIFPGAPLLIYRATFRLRNQSEFNALAVPDLRVRLATNDFQRSVSGVLVSVSDGVTVPTPGSPRDAVIYMVLEEKPNDFNAFVAAFDILSFYPGRGVTSQPLEVDSVRIDRLFIPKYPAPR